MQGKKATAEAIEPPRPSDHNERKTFTMATKNVTPTIAGLKNSLTDADAMNQSATEAIAALADAAQGLLALNAPALIKVKTLLEEIRERANRHQDDINCLAERNGADYVGDREFSSRIWAEHHKLNPPIEGA